MLKKFTLVCGVALALSVLAVAVMVVSPGSSAKAASSDPAIVIRDIGCGMLDGNGAPVFTPESQAVITSSGNSSLTCSAQVTPSSTAQGAVHWNFDNTGLVCSTTAAITQQWEEVVTPSGQATLSCHFNGSSK